MFEKFVELLNSPVLWTIVFLLTVFGLLGLFFVTKDFLPLIVVFFEWIGFITGMLVGKGE